MTPTPRPPNPSKGNSTFAERRAARLEREAEHGVPQRRQTALHAGPDAEAVFTIIDHSATDGSSA